VPPGTPERADRRANPLPSAPDRAPAATARCSTKEAGPRQPSASRSSGPATNDSVASVPVLIPSITVFGRVAAPASMLRLLTRPVASSGRPRTCASSPLRWRHDGHNPDRVSNRPDDAAARFRSRGSSSRLHGARLLAGSHVGCREQALSRARDPRSGEDRSPGAATPTSALQGRPEARRAPCKVVKARLCHRRVAGVAGRALQGAVGDGRMPAPTRNEVSRVASFRIVSRFRKSAFGVVALSLLVLTSGATGVGLACATGARSSRVRLGE